MAHAFDNHNASLSEGAPLAAVVGALPGKPYWKRVGTDSPHPLRQSEARLRLARPRLAPRVGAPHGREEGGGSDPLFFGAGAPPGRGRWCARMVTPSPLPVGGRSLHRDPCGKAVKLAKRPALGTAKPGAKRQQATAPKPATTPSLEAGTTKDLQVTGPAAFYST